MAASYCAIRLNAATDSLNNDALEAAPSLACSSVKKPSYWLASVNTATCCQFLAALRTMAGPPISIFSMASSSVQFGLATVDSNGYKFTTNKSIFGISCACMVATCSGKSRQPRSPPCTLGCSVFTRPSNISGKPV